MSFIDSFKKRKIIYSIILSLTISILIINNIFQLMILLRQNKWIILLMTVTFTLIMIYIAFNQNEIFGNI